MLQINLPQANDLLQFYFDFSGFDPGIFWIVFYVFILAFIVISFILSYHWKNFIPIQKDMKKIFIIYFSVSSLFLISMLVSLKIYLSSVM